MKIVCKFCGISAENVEFLIKHMRLHKKESKFECPFENCVVFFKSFAVFVQHIRQRHIGRKNSVEVECPIMDCEFMSSDFKRITKHVVKHISEGHPVFCPLKCRTGKPFATPNSLRIHNMYFHRIGVPRNLSRPDVSQPKYGSTDQVCAPHPEVTVCNTDVEDVGKADQEEKTEIEQRVELNSNFEMVIGSLLLKLLSKNHVTDVVIQEIVDAMDEALTIEKQFLNFKCKSFASENSLSAEVTGKLINSMCSDNLQSNLFGPKGKFRSSYTRKKFFRENFAYVSPVQILLQRDGDHNSCFYYYVPILQTLSTLRNVVKFCAEHHQYYQGLLNTKNNRFEKKIVAEKYLESSAFLPCSTTDLLGKSGLLHDQNLYAEEAVYCGHDYKKGQFLFLSHDEYGEVFFVLKIQLLIFEPKTNNLYIFGEKQAVTNIHEKGLLVVQREVLDTEVKNIETFIDRTPLETYIESSKEYLFIKHTIPLIN